MTAEPQVRVDNGLADYFARIGFDGPGRADLPTLRSLHALHPAAVPFEAIDVLLGRGISLVPDAVDAKLVTGGRGGYCFEQNGLFRRVLTRLGFAVTPRLARVLWSLPAGMPPQPRTHMVLQLTLDGVPWLADVGFGSVVPTTPLRLDTEAPQETLHEAFRIVPTGGERLLQVLRDGTWLPVYRVSMDAAEEADFEVANWYTSTHPASHFGRTLMVARITPEARYTLLNDRLTVRPPGGAPEQRSLDADGIEQALGRVFGLPVEAAWRPVIERAALAG